MTNDELVADVKATLSDIITSAREEHEGRDSSAKLSRAAYTREKENELLALVDAALSGAAERDIQRDRDIAVGTLICIIAEIRGDDYAHLPGAEEVSREAREAVALLRTQLTAAQREVDGLARYNARLESAVKNASVHARQRERNAAICALAITETVGWLPSDGRRWLDEKYPPLPIPATEADERCAKCHHEWHTAGGGYCLQCNCETFVRPNTETDDG